MKTITPRRLQDLLDAFGTATFECGQWPTDSPETYDAVWRRAVATERAIFEALGLTRPRGAVGQLPNPLPCVTSATQPHDVTCDRCRPRRDRRF